MTTTFEQLRAQMVETQIAARGITDERVLAAMRNVPREQFVPETERRFAYEDAPLPIGNQQTISQPYIVAYMIAALELIGTETVLEIGAGSGYAAAVLAEIVTHVDAVERIRDLAETAKANLDRAGYKNVDVHHADGTFGWPQTAPFDAILVSAGAPELPRALMEQLAPNGRMVVPVGCHPHEQQLLRITRTDTGEFKEERLSYVRFVPLVGAKAWHGDNSD